MATRRSAANARVALALTALALGIYLAMIVDHLPP